MFLEKSVTLVNTLTQLVGGQVDLHERGWLECSRLRNEGLALFIIYMSTNVYHKCATKNDN